MGNKGSSPCPRTINHINNRVFLCQRPRPSTESPCSQIWSQVGIQMSEESQLQETTTTSPDLKSSKTRVTTVQVLAFPRIITRNTQPKIAILRSHFSTWGAVRWILENAAGRSVKQMPRCWLPNANKISVAFTSLPIKKTITAVLMAHSKKRTIAAVDRTPIFNSQSIVKVATTVESCEKLLANLQIIALCINTRTKKHQVRPDTTIKTHRCEPSYQHWAKRRNSNRLQCSILVNSRCHPKSPQITQVRTTFAYLSRLATLTLGS